MYCHIAKTIRNTGTLAKRNDAPCMVHYKLVEGGILAGTASNKSPFRLTAKLSSSQPEMKFYDPDDDGEEGYPCGAHWTTKLSSSINQDI